MDASRTAQIAPVCAREAGKEIGLGRAARSGRDQAEPEGFKCIHVCWLSANFAIRTETFHSRCRHLGYLIWKRHGKKDKKAWKKHGKKDKKAWEGDYPKKETLKLWAQFITDNFEDGDEPAGPQVFQGP